ncbi:MAG: sigma-70 family RNA polymerase sigma factor [Candidatus Latescibacterota bacterium]|nr:MAG: sigma-70 family RNA polymerase sigma factor [Candidatus Latescibacterota bacterium]
MKISDQELVSRAQKGETNAFEELVYRYDRKVLSIASSFTNDPDDTQDIYQEVFLRVYRALPGFRFGSQFSTWLYRIVMNVCLSHKTRQASHAHAELDTVIERDHSTSGHEFTGRARPVSPDEFAQNREIRSYVEQALEMLSPREKLVFTLKHFEGYKLREIALMIDCGEGTAKRYLFSAVGKIRKRLKKVFR